VTDVFADRCTLNWKAPKDVCGAPDTDYLIELDEGCTGEIDCVTRTQVNFIPHFL